MRTVVQVNLRKLGLKLPRQRYQRGTLRTSVPRHGDRPERKLPRGEYWAEWSVYVKSANAKEKDKRRQREKIITRELAEKYHVAKDYTGPLTRSDAQRVLDLLIAEDAGIYVRPDTEAKFGQIAREYIALNQAHWGEHTTRTSVNTIEKHLIEKLGERPVTAITSLELQTFLNEFIGSGASKSLLSKLLLYLRAILDYAVGKRIVLANPARDPGQRLRAKSHKRENARALSVEECQRLLGTLIGRDRLIVRMFIQLGLRPEELFGLRPEHIRADAVVITDGKTEASDAPVFMPPDLARDVRAYMDVSSGPWLFTGTRGAQVDRHNYLNRILKPAGVRAKIGLREVSKEAGKVEYTSDVNFQVLRRTSGTLFGEKARDPRLTQAHLRHTDPQVTLKHYQQSIPAAVKAAALAVEADLLQNNSEGVLKGQKIQ